MLASPASLLLLDEPTNHLDMRSCEVLSAALADYEGTLCVISHDRYFLDGFVNRVWEIGHGSVQEYIGNYSEYENSKAKEFEIESLNPTTSIREPSASPYLQDRGRKRLEAEERNRKHQVLKPLMNRRTKLNSWKLSTNKPNWPVKRKLSLKNGTNFHLKLSTMKLRTFLKIR